MASGRLHGGSHSADESARVTGYTGVFKRMNYFMLMVMMFIFFDKLPGFLL
jgi:hypothetical protein